MRRSIELQVICALVFALVATVAVAQEPAEEAPEYPLGFMIKVKVDPARSLEYVLVAMEIAEALKTHENAIPYSVWGHATGGPGDVYYWVFPMQKFGDMDGWPTIAGAVMDRYGPEEARKIWDAYHGAVAKSRNMIIATVDGLSNIDLEAEPPKFGYYWHVKVKPGKVREWADIMRKFVAANKDHAEGVHWSTSRCIIGEEDPEFYVFMGMNDWGELGNMQKIEKVLLETYGEEETTAMFTAGGQISRGTGNLLMLVEELSNLPATE